ncbi:MAG TPA: hypothetical protein VJT31_40615, partial [Rugosimonospora sp.]|nr:hypothetical protein [Rugosimonospora sp.]
MPDAASLDAAVLRRAIGEAMPGTAAPVIVDLRLVPTVRLSVGLAEQLSGALGVTVELPHNAVRGAVGSRTFAVGPDGERTLGVFAAAYQTVPEVSRLPAPVSHPLPDGWVADEVGQSVFLHPATVSHSSLLNQVAQEAAGTEQHVIFIDGRQSPPASLWAALRQSADTIAPDVARRLVARRIVPDPLQPSTVDANGTGTATDPALAAYHQSVLRLRADLPDNAEAEHLAGFTVRLYRSLLGRRGGGIVHPDLGFRDDAAATATRFADETDPKHAASLDYVNWQIQLSPELVDPDRNLDLTQDEVTERIATALWHEWEHVEQFRDIARYLAATHRTRAELEAVFPIRNTALLDAALDDPLEVGTPEFDRAAQLYEHAFGAAQGQRGTVEQRIAVTGAAAEQAEAELAAAQFGNTADPNLIARLALERTRTRIDHALALEEYQSLHLEAGPYQQEAALRRLLRSGPASRSRPAAGRKTYRSPRRRYPVARLVPVVTRPRGLVTPQAPRQRAISAVGQARRLSGSDWIAVGDGDPAETAAADGVAVVQARLGLSDGEVARMARLLGAGSDQAGRVRAVEAADLRREMSGRLGFDGAVGLRAAHQVLSVMRAEFAADVAQVHGPLSMAHLLPLVQAVVRPNAPGVEADDVVRFADALRLAASRKSVSLISLRVAHMQGVLELSNGEVTRLGRMLGVDARPGRRRDNWQRVVEAANLRHVLGRQGEADLRVADQMTSLLWREFPDSVADLDRPLDARDLAPLVRAVVDRDASPVTPDHVIRLAAAVRLADARGELSVAGLRVAARQSQLGLSDTDVAAYGETLAVDTTPEAGIDGWRRVVEAAGVHDEVAGQPQLSAENGLRAADGLLSGLSDGFPGFTGYVRHTVGPLATPDLLPMVRALIDPNAASVTPSHVEQLVEFSDVLAPFGDWSLPAFRMMASVLPVVKRLQVSGIDLAGLHELVPEETVEGLLRAVEARDLHHELSAQLEVAGADGLTATVGLLGLFRQHFDVSPKGGLLTVHDLQPLVEATMGGTATETPASVATLIGAARMAGARGDLSLDSLGVAVSQLREGVTDEVADRAAGWLGLAPGVDGWRQAVEATLLYRSIGDPGGATEEQGVTDAHRLLILVRSHTPELVPTAPVTAASLLPLVQDVLGGQASPVTGNHIEELSTVVDLAARNGDTSMRGLRTANVQRMLGLSPDQVAALGTELGLPVASTPEHARLVVEAQALRQSLDRPGIPVAPGLPAAHRLLALLRGNFGDRLPTDRPLAKADLGPLVRSVLDPATEVTAESVTELSTVVDQANQNGDTSMLGLRTAQLQRTLGLSRPELGALGVGLGLDLGGNPGDSRAVLEAEALRRAAFGRSGLAGLRAAHQLLTVLRGNFAGGLPADRPLVMGDLLPLYQATLNPGAAELTSERVVTLSQAARAAQQEGDPSLPGIRGSAAAAAAARTLDLPDKRVQQIRALLGGTGIAGRIRAVEAEYLRRMAPDQLGGTVELGLRAAHRLSTAVRVVTGMTDPLAGPLTQADLLAVVAPVLDTPATEVTAHHVGQLSEVATVAAAYGEFTVRTLRTDRLQTRVPEQSLNEVAAMVDMQLAPQEAWVRAVEAAGVHEAVRAQPGLAGPQGLRTVAHMLALVRDSFHDSGTAEVGPLNMQDLAPLVRLVRDSNTQEVSAADVAALAVPVQAALVAGDGSVRAVWAHATQARLGVSDQDVAAAGRQLRRNVAMGLDNRVHVLEALAFQQHAAQRDTARPPDSPEAQPRDLSAFAQLSTLTRRHLGRDGAAVGLPLNAADLLPLVRAVIDPAATEVSPDHLASLSTSVATAAWYGRPALRAVQKIAASAPAQHRLELTNQDVGEIAKQFGLPDNNTIGVTSEDSVDGFVRAVEIADLHRRLNARPGVTQRQSLLADATRLLALRQLLNVLYTEAPETRTGPLTMEQLAPLVRAIFDPRAIVATDEQLNTMTDAVLDATRRGVTTVTLPVLRQAITTWRMQQRSNRSDDQVRGDREILGRPDDMNGWTQAVQARNLARQMSGDDDAQVTDETLRAAHLVLDLARSNFREHLADVAGPLNVDHLLPLVQRVLNPDLSRATPEHIAQIIGAVNREAVRRPRLSTLERYFRQAALRPDGADGQQDRNKELREVRAALPSGVDRAVKSRANLQALMDLRRADLSDPRTRGFTDLSAYEPLALELLGKSYVDGQVMQQLAQLAVQARRAASPARPGRGGRILRAVEPPGGKRWIRRGAGMVRVLSRKRLVAVALDRYWSTEPPAQPEPAEDYNEIVPGQQYPIDFSHFDELVTWLNGITPGGRAGLSAEQVKTALTQGFGSALDEGVPFRASVGGRVSVGGREYLIDLHSAVPRPPTHDKSVAAPDAKLEQRVNAIELDSTASRQDAWSGFTDAAAVVKAGQSSLAAVTLGFTGGRSWGRVRQSVTGASGGRYMYLKPDDKVAPMHIPVEWSAQLTDVQTGRQRVVDWTDSNGKPREESVIALVSSHLLPTGERNRREIHDNSELPLAEMHHAVERMHGVRKLRKELRKTIGPELYTFFQPEIELFLSNDRQSSWHYGALRGHEATRGTVEKGRHEALLDTPRLMVRRDGRFLDVAVTFEAQTAEEFGKPTDKETSVKYDRISQGSGKWGVMREPRTRGWRASLPAALRLAFSVVNVNGRVAGTWSGYKQWTRSSTSWLLRVMRAQDTSRVLKVDGLLTLHVHAGVDPGALAAARSKVKTGWGAVKQVSATSAPVPGWVQVRVREKEYTKQSYRPDSSKHWWSLGEDTGIGLATIKSITGLDQVYDDVVREMVSRGLLPSEAAGDPGSGLTPSQVLAELPISGEALNKPGVVYENWRILVEDTLSPSMLTRRSDDLFGGSITRRFTHPDGSTVTLGLNGQPATGEARHLHTDDMMPVNTLVAQDEVGVRRGERKTNDISADGGFVFEVQGGDKPDHEHRPWWHLKPFGFSFGGSRRTASSRRTGEKSSSTFIAYVRTTGDTNLFEMPLRLGWSLDDGAETTPEIHQSGATMQAYQPQSLTGGGSTATPGKLSTVDENGVEIPSPLIGMVARAPVAVSGLSDLQQALIDKRLEQARS